MKNIIENLFNTKGEFAYLFFNQKYKNIAVAKEDVINALTKVVNEDLVIPYQSKLEEIVAPYKVWCKDYYFFTGDKKLLGKNFVIPNLHIVFEDNLGESFVFYLSEQPASNVLETNNFDDCDSHFVKMKESGQQIYVDYELEVNDLGDLEFICHHRDNSFMLHKYFSEITACFDEKRIKNTILSFYNNSWELFILGELKKLDEELLKTPIQLSLNQKKVIELFGEENILGINLPQVFCYSEKINDVLLVNK